MLDQDTFSHTGSGGSDPGDRIKNAGYRFTGSWTWGENIAWNGTTGTPDVTQSVATQHENLFVDLNIPGRGHRINLMNENFREIGLGTVTGLFTSNGTDFNAVMTTQDFAKSGSGSFLTGVAYDDQDNDDFYTPGEGLGGVTEQAVRQSDGQTFTTNTMDAGGYQIQLESGNYIVTFSGGGLDETIRQTIAIGDYNVKLDAILDDDSDGNSDGNGTTPTPIPGTGGNHDLTGTAGNDSIIGGAGDENITGGPGNDSLFGGPGNDSLLGGAGNDFLTGGEGRDLLLGGGGRDTFVLEIDTASASLGSTDRILDFQPGTDRIGLTTTGGPISLSLILSDGQISIKDVSSDKFLATVANVTFNDLISSFVLL